MKLKAKDTIFVSVQFVLFIAYFVDIHFIPFKLTYPIYIISIIILVLGFLMVIISMLQLNKNLSPFPTPKLNSKLIKNGLFKYIRHPIYTGILLFTFGYGLYKTSSYKLIITLLLLILFYFKTKYEEELLINKFFDYKLYQKTAGRFLPKF